MHINHSENVKINYACSFCYLLAFSMQWTQEWTEKLHSQLKRPKAFYSQKNFPLIYVHVWICLLKAINHLWNCLHFFVSFFWKLKLLMAFSWLEFILESLSQLQIMKNMLDKEILKSLIEFYVTNSNQFIGLHEKSNVKNRLTTLEVKFYFCQAFGEILTFSCVFNCVDFFLSKL